MKRIFSAADFNDPELAANYDELPLWSAPFGLKLLEAIDYSKPVEALDIGSGSGFPLLELAQRFGNQSHFTGIDTWAEGIERTKFKIRFCQINNVHLECASAEKMPFNNETFSLITSNNGLNNVSSEKNALLECYRVLKKGCSLVFTANLPGTMSSFYKSFKTIISETGLNELNNSIDNHIKSKRKSPEEMKILTEEAGFRLVSAEIFSFRLGFANGSAFLNHFLIRLYFLQSWLSLIPENKRTFIMNLIEEQLNQIALTAKGLFLDVPYCIYHAKKEY
ncbi:MAG: class I SAM-dependent methyltransferase [Lentimicrobium sp.]